MNERADLAIPVPAPSPAPPPSAFRLLPWLLGSLLAVLMAWKDWQRLDGLVVDHAVAWGRDFAIFWTGGRLAVLHRLDLLYPLQSFAMFQNSQFGPLRQHNYAYPPTSLFIAMPFGMLPYTLGLAAWLGGTGACFLLAARGYVRRVPGFPLIAALLTPTATINIWSGQYGFLAGALWLAACARAERAPVQAGLWAALLTVKPHLGVLLPLILAWRRCWRAMAWAALFTGLLVLASGLVFGFPLWRSYVYGTSVVQAALLHHRDDFFFKMMPTVLVATRMLGLPDAIGWPLQLIAAAGAVLACRHAARGGADMRDLGLVAATATFLVLPYAFDYDMTAASLGMALMLHRHWPALSRRDRALLILGFVSPQAIILSGFVGLPVGPLLVGGALWVQARIAGTDVVSARPVVPAGAVAAR